MTKNDIELNYNIVPVEDWINSEYFVGRRVIYPFWKEEFIKHRKSNNIKFICYGSFGLGKTMFSQLNILRDVYEIHAYKNFPGLFGLDSSTKLKLAYISMTLQKSDSTGIGKFIRMVDSIPFFHNEVRRDRNLVSIARFPQLDIISASNVSHITGEDCYGVIFDESNFNRAKKGDEYNKAKELFIESQIRGSSRFSVGGVHCGIFGLLSSPKDETSFTESYIKSSMLRGDASIVRSALYKIKPEAYREEKFKVFAGYSDVDPFIVDTVPEGIQTYVNKNYGQTLDQFLKSHPEAIEDVPVDLRPYYEDDIKTALKDISAIPQRTSSLLLKNPSWLRNAFKPNLKSPLLKQTVLLSLGSDEMIQDYVDDVLMISQYNGENVYIHFDLMKNIDEGGFSAIYKTEANRFRSLLYFAFHKSKEKEQVDYQKLCDICFWLTDLGVSIKKITFDQFQSVMPQQILEKRYGKDRVGQLSVVEDDTAYMTFNYLLKKGLMELYYYEHFSKQYAKLIYDKASGKVDHPEGWDKGVSDSQAGATLSCIMGEGLDREDIVVDNLTPGKTEDDFYSELMGGKKEDDFYSSLIDGLGNEDQKSLDDFKTDLIRHDIKKGDIDGLMKEFERDYEKNF